MIPFRLPRPWRVAALTGLLGGSERFGGTAEGWAGIGRFDRCDVP